MRIYSKISNWLRGKFHEASVRHRILRAGKHGFDRMPKELTAFEYKHTRLSRYTGLMDVFDASVSGLGTIEIALQRSAVRRSLATPSTTDIPYVVFKGLWAAQRTPV